MLIQPREQKIVTPEHFSLTTTCTAFSLFAVRRSKASTSKVHMDSPNRDIVAYSVNPAASNTGINENDNYASVGLKASTSCQQIVCPMGNLLSVEKVSKQADAGLVQLTPNTAYQQRDVALAKGQEDAGMVLNTAYQQRDVALAVDVKGHKQVGNLKDPEMVPNSVYQLGGGMVPNAAYQQLQNFAATEQDDDKPYYMVP
jgi:hypothetical protein